MQSLGSRILGTGKVCLNSAVFLIYTLALGATTGLNQSANEKDALELAAGN